MNISDTKLLAKYVTETTPEEAERLIKLYGDQRQELGIEHGWKGCRKLWAWVNENRRRKFRKFLLEYDVDNGAVEFGEFLKFFCAIEDEMVKYSRDRSKEVGKFAKNMQSAMYAHLGNIKIDRRSLFQKN